MVDTRSNMQLSDFNSKPHGVQSLIGLIDCGIRDQLYPPPCSEHHTLLCIDKLHVPTHFQVNSHDNPDAK